MGQTVNQTPDNQTDMYELEKYKITLDFLKFEATTLWQIFNAFFIGHAIFLGFIGSAIAAKEWNNIHPCILIIASLVGLALLCPWYKTFSANSEWYYFRMAQARKAEKKFVDNIKDAEWYLLNKEANQFAEGSKVSIVISENEKRDFHLTCILKNKFAGKFMITVFALVYISIIFACIVTKCSCSC